MRSTKKFAVGATRTYNISPSANISEQLLQSVKALRLKKMRSTKKICRRRYKNIQYNISPSANISEQPFRSVKALRLKKMRSTKKICRRVCQQKYMTIRLGLFRLSFSNFCERCAASPTKIGSARQKIPTPHFCHLFLLTYLGAIKHCYQKIV
jgi:ribosomal protein L30/L7E